ncbi:MAG: carbohydrate-binding family 9-like protein, partial [Phycisphaeraceae bacterium JB051]
MIQKMYFMLTMHLLLPAMLLAVTPMSQIPEIDGKLLQGEWQQAKHFGRFITTIPEQDQPNKPTQAWFGFDQKNLYIAFDCADPDTGSIQSNIQTRDGTLWFDDCVEFFFKPIQSRPEYYHFIINPRGMVFDQLCRPNEVGVHKNWDAMGIIAAAGITSSGWQVEVRIPLSNFPIAGNVWAMNLARTSQKPTVEYSSIQGMKNGFHRPQAFRIIKPQIDSRGFAPGIEIMDVGQRQVGKNIAKIRIINEQALSADASMHCTIVNAGKTSSPQTTVTTLNGDREQI